MNKSLITASVIGTLALASASAAFAQVTTVKLGWVNVDPRSTASNVAGPFTPVDALSTSIKPQSTLFFGIAREIDTNFEVELAMGIPPKHDAALVVVNPAKVPSAVAARDGAIISKVAQVAPTLFLNYKFGQASSQFRPFVGLGFNFTRFTDAESTAVNDNVNGGATTIKMSDSRGMAAQLGVTAKISGPWSATASWTTAKVSSIITTNTLGIERTVDVNFNPSVFALTVGYSF